MSSSSSEDCRKNYMKEYMRNRYHADKEKSRGYKNSLRYKSKLNISDEDYQKYGNHLADVIKLAENKAVKSLIPTEDAFKVPAIPAPPETVKLPEVVVPEPVVFDITTGPEEITVPKPVILSLSVDRSTVSESV